MMEISEAAEWATDELIEREYIPRPLTQRRNTELIIQHAVNKATKSIREDFEHLSEMLNESEKEVDRLSKRDCNATIELCYSDENNPFARETLSVIDVGVADNCYVVESEVLKNTQEEVKKLKKQIHHMVACCGNPDKDEALRNVIKIGQEALEK